MFLSTVSKLFLATLNRFQSKKFIVWLVGCVALFSHFITASDWMMLTMTYVGVQGVLDFKSGPTPSTAIPVSSNGKTDTSPDDPTDILAVSPDEERTE
jgi:hypothetical protein